MSCLTAVVVCLASCHLGADESKSVENPFRDDPAVAPASAPADPTVPASELKKALQPTRIKESTGEALKLPTVQLRGRVISADGVGVALLSVNGRLERAGVGREFLEADGTLIQVIAVSATEVRLKYLPHDRTVGLR